MVDGASARSRGRNGRASFGSSPHLRHPLSPPHTMGAQQSTPASAPAAPPPGCPMHEQQPAAPTPAPPPPAGCPMHNDQQSPFAQHAARGQVNPVNNMPTLAQAPAQGQKMALPLERTMSSIPRASSASSSASGSGSSSPAPMACPVAHGSSDSPDAKAAAPADKAEQWEYPSPQQFYNALVRKGWETPEESVEMMVSIHNWINEEAWAQVRQWEEKHPGSVALFLSCTRTSCGRVLTSHSYATGATGHRWLPSPVGRRSCRPRPATTCSWPSSSQTPTRACFRPPSLPATSH